MFGWILSQLWRAARAVLELLGLVSRPPGLGGGRGPRVLVKAGGGRTVGLELRPGWTVRDVKVELSSLLGPEIHQDSLRIIFAGRELPDLLAVESCQLGNQSVLHAVTVLSKQEEQPPPPASSVTQTSEAERLAFFYCWCPDQDLLSPAKLRVRCSDCGAGAILLHTEPSSWEDVLRPARIQGHCQICQEVRSVTFFFRCGSERHRTEGSEGHDTAALERVRRNTESVECLACGEVGQTVLLFSCGHVTCTSCFTDYCRSRLADRQFLLHPDLGYTLRCPLDCAGTELPTNHFRLLTSTLWERYLAWGAEELVLQSGGVLCPQPGCGAGILTQPQPDCRRVGCAECGYVFCRDCREGAHHGPCLPCPDLAPQEAGEAGGGGREGPGGGARHVGADPSSVTIRIISKPCPGCRTPTERAGGCMHMICTKAGCGLHWCWVCQEDWTRDCMASHWFG